LTRLLLDTHIWLWSVGEPERLTRRVASALSSLENELWLSPVSVWELVVLKQKGRITLDEDLETLIPRALRTLPLREASLTFEVAREVGRLKLPHRDPADQFLVATARVFDLTLVTADQNLLEARAVPVLANR
jgi:PIN domain nuclease of toxin-antitoxin system